MLESKLIGLKQLEKTLKTTGVKDEKALSTAIKVEGFRLMRLLKKQIVAGAPGGQKFAPLTFLSRAFGGAGRMRPNKPLRRLAVAVRYHVPKQSPIEMHVGWTGPRTSKSWKRIAEMQQEGFESGITDKRRRYFLFKAAAMPKRSAARKYLFLKPGTTRFKTPGRPIMEPFWRSEKDRAWRNIRNNYRLKLKGERI